MDQNFYSVSVFETDFLHLVDFWFDFQHSVSTWIKIFTTHQFSMKKLFLENWSCRKSRSQRINYLVNFHRKNVKASCFVLFAKVVPEKVLFIDKKFFDQNFWKKISFWIIFAQRVTFWIKNFKSVILRAIFLQLDNVRIEKFRTCQISKRKFYNASDFGVEMFCIETHLGERVALRNFFMHPYTLWKRQFLQLCSL